ncbi:amino acid/amide ABC transporter ATP-binding protein 1 (HAAT family) [Bosea sp. BK604]|nr:amino acid/amide ABC transporter ATP-binding protein 1 (HAAT family) [Bosea sp. BK604]
MSAVPAMPVAADAATPSRDIVLRTEKLTKVFGGFKAVDDVSFAVERGTIHAVIGPNGAGKTTLFNLLTKFHLPTTGRIFYGQDEITTMPADETARQGIVRSFQIAAVFPQMTAYENVRLALQQRMGNWYRFWSPERSLAGLRGRAEELLAAVGLSDFCETYASDLSYGRKRALEIATTLAMEPRILLLDEPMAGLGHEDIDRVAALIREVAIGRTVLLVEHNLRVVADLSDTITVMTRGRVLAEGSYAELAANPAVVEAYMGTGHG